MSDLLNAFYTPKPAERVFDEIVTGTGSMRAHWQSLLGRLAPLDSPAMAERVEESTRLLRQNDVTYTVYGDAGSGERLWPLDIMPLLIPADEWRAISKGVLQRARLLNALLADLYGARRVIAEGNFPPALIEANPGFLRPCDALQPTNGTFLHLYACDLGRAPDGSWRVLADRTETPSGAGYALENRSVIGQVLGDCLTDARIAPLAPFFTALRDGLMAAAPPGRASRDAPRVVLLTPGPYNETYFEHLFLAGHLGITLVQGADLTVRDSRVFIKTVSALEPVDVILRRVDDNFCDPLELFPDSALGVPGLVEAVRAGNVTVANALGSGVVQAIAFKPYFPALARMLLGEDLLLPDVVTWWCGTDEARNHVLANLNTFAVRPAFATVSVLRGTSAAAGDAEELAARIKARPFEYAAQVQVSLSNAPVWENGKLEPRPVSLRVYVAAGPDGYVIMPGGLSRTSIVGTTNVSMQSGGGSKDTWVLNDALSRPAEAAPSPASTSNVVAMSENASRRPAMGALPSRAADSLYWTGRYAERVSGTVRLLRAIVANLTDPVRPWSLADAEPLLNLTGYLSLLPWIEPLEATPPQVIGLVQKTLIDPKHPNGLRMLLARLTGAAGNVRDRLPSDCWRALTTLGRSLQFVGERASPVQVLLRLNEAITLSTSLAGAIDESMPRGDAWRFLEVGKRVERAIHLVAILRGTADVRRDSADHIVPVPEHRQLQAILALTGIPLQRRELDRRSVLEAVLMNADDPRTLLHQLAALNTQLACLPRVVSKDGDGAMAQAAVMVGEAMILLREGLAIATRPNLKTPPRANLKEAENNSLRAAFALLDAVLPDISDRLARAYFTHALARRA